jgi:hypothetical protein
VSQATIERLVNRDELSLVKVAGSTRHDVQNLDRYFAISKSSIANGSPEVMTLRDLIEREVEGS